MSRENLKFIHIKIPQGSSFLARPELQFEQLLAGIYNALPGQKLGCELFATNQYIYFILAIPSEHFSTLESMVYAHFSDAEIIETGDYLLQEKLTNTAIATTELSLKKSHIYPIADYAAFEVDSLSGIFTVLSKVQKERLAFVQLEMTPIRDGWQHHFSNVLKTKINNITRIFHLKYIVRGKAKKEIHATQNRRIVEKISQPMFKVAIKLGYAAENWSTAQDGLMALAKAYYHFNENDLNQFIFSKIKNESGRKSILAQRQHSTNFNLSLKELATVYHFPNPDVTPHISHVLSRKAEPPQDLPKQKDQTTSLFGLTNYHNQFVPFGINRADRRRHLYVVGKSGVGKSKLLELLIKEDICAGKGVGILDPHGDLVDNILKFIPENRIKDVVYFDPSDTGFPIAFNPLENVSEEYKVRITIGFIDIFKKLFGASWTSRLEHVLRYTTLALLDSPGTTVFSILKILTDKNYRQRIVAGIQDSVVKNFWVNEFAGWSEKFDNEAITPLLNKVGQFVSTSMIRNIVGQPDNTFDLREIMDNQKILLMKVSKGILGEENASLIGSMVITKIQQAAMSRADTPEDGRKDFYFYVDEFQNFATDTFAEILSEARKYRLNLTIAHQYMGQLNDTVRKTVFGNVGNIISFRVGAEDAEVLAKEYNPIFEVRDIINLGVQEFYIKMSVNGELSNAFSGRTIKMDIPQVDYTDQILTASRQKYARPVKQVEELLKAWEEGGIDSGREHGTIKPSDQSSAQVFINDTEDSVFEMPLV